MAIKNSKKTPVLPELEKYYEAEQKERAGLAWLLSIVSVAAVALLIIGIYFGGRAVYRNLTNDNSAEVAVVEENNKSNNEVANKEETDLPTETDTPVVSNTTPSTSQTQGNQSTNTNAQSSSQTNTPRVLVNTGSENILPIFVIVTLLGVFAYRVKLSRN